MEKQLQVVDAEEFFRILVHQLDLLEISYATSTSDSFGLSKDRAPVQQGLH